VLVVLAENEEINMGWHDWAIVKLYIGSLCPDLQPSMPGQFQHLAASKQLVASLLSCFDGMT
jgi:hypothetical protein